MNPSPAISDRISVEVIEPDSNHVLQETAMGCDTGFVMESRIDGYVFLLLQERDIWI